ncbi:HET domain containing protein [Hyaloscypha variabilis]
MIGSKNFYTPENARFYAANLYQPLDPDVDNFRILEILPGNDSDNIICNIIQPFHLDTSYEALSYRAGDPRDIGEITVNGQLFNAFASLFAAIKRLRYPDKSRLVWIDQICINQSDVAERSSQVPKMRKVYERAERVIAWLGPLFAGIANEYIKELELASQTENNEHLVKAKALAQLLYSKFWTRVWIWQEIIVAKSVELVWDTKSMDSEPFFTTAEMIAVMKNTISFNQLPKATTAVLKTTTCVFISAIATLRRHWEPESPLIHKYLLRKVRLAQSSDVRDRIYAISGLISPDYQIIPDYTSAPATVYCRTAWSMISRDRSLDLLTFCGHPTLQSTLVLPSWCSDWSTKSRKTRYPLSDRRSDYRLQPTFAASLTRFQASKNIPSSCRMESVNDKETGIQSFALFVEGLHIDIVKKVNKNPVVHQYSDDVYQELLESCSRIVSKRGTLTEELKMEVQKTLIVDNYGSLKNSRPRYSPNGHSAKLDAIQGRRLFFISRTGLMGMAPRHVQPGDLICVFFGAKIPVWLRRKGKVYVLIGEVYISDGYMEGRAIDEMEVATRRLFHPTTWFKKPRSPEWFEIH